MSAKGPADGTFSTYLAPNDMAWVKDAASRKAEIKVCVGKVKPVQDSKVQDKF